MPPATAATTLVAYIAVYIEIMAEGSRAATLFGPSAGAMGTRTPFL